MFISKALAQTAEVIEETAATPDAPNAMEAFIMNMGLIAILVVLFYVLMIRPQQRRMKEHQKMLGGLEKGSTIVTQGGVIGKIEKVLDDNSLLIKSGNTEMTILRSAIMSTLDEATPSKK
ncbi:MAG: preprotein translocase subunit YajC [Pseudobdellovibrionaceae bacterium]